MDQEPKSKGPITVCITSGKGGVGKTLTTVNLALCAQRRNQKVLIVDGDVGLANVDVVLGLQVKRTIQDVLSGEARLDDVIVEGPEGIRIIPSGSGVSSLGQLSPVQRQLLLQQINDIQDEYDVMFIDTGAGISDTVLSFNAVAHRSVVVTTSEPHAMTDAYALIKVMSENYGKKSFDMIVNLARSEGEGLKIASRIADVANRFLGVPVEYLGFVPPDPQLRKWIQQRNVATAGSIHSISGQAWNRIGNKLLGNLEGQAPFSSAKDFWRNLVGAQAYAHEQRPQRAY